MKQAVIFLSFAVILACGQSAFAQKRRPARSVRPAAATSEPREVGSRMVVIDEKLSVLRKEPSLFAEVVQRMRLGRQVVVTAVSEADGVKFYRVAAPGGNGWIQAEAVYAKGRKADEERLAKLILASDGFDQIETALYFFQLFPASERRPSMLLLFGDLVERTAAKLAKSASGQISRGYIAAGGAPPESYYLNFVSLDRYRKLGIIFKFNPATRMYHYDGASWRELVHKFPASPYAAEGTKRLEKLKISLERKAAE